MSKTRTIRLLIWAAVVILPVSAVSWVGGAGAADTTTVSWHTIMEARVPPSPAIDSTFVLEDYLRLASERSPALRQAYYEWRAAEEKVGYAGSPPNPVLSYGRFLESVETRVGPQEWRLGLRQDYPWFGTLGARGDGAREAAKAARQKFESRRLRLFHEVKSAYSDLYYLGRELELTRENLQLLAFWESVARTRYEVGLEGHPDVMRAQVELGKLEDRLITLEDEVGPAGSRLRALLDLPADVIIPIPAVLEVEEIEVSRGGILRSIKSANPDLDYLRHVIGEAEAGVRLAGKSSYPNLSFGVDFIETGESVNLNVADSGKNAWAVGIGVELPIWFGKNRARKAEAEAARKRAEYNLIDRENSLIALADQVIFEHDDALRKLGLYRDGLIPKAEQSLNASYTAYKVGELDFLNVLDAQRQLLDFQLEKEKAVARLSVKQSEIEMICGRNIAELAKK